MKLRVYNPTLDPNLWNEDKTLKPEVKDALLKIAEDFYNSTDLKAEIQNILFLGSSANYNWTPTSDIDLHIVVDVAGEKIHDEYARKFMDGLSFKWNEKHHIEVKGHPVEVYLQDVREPNTTAQQARPGAAIYSIFDDGWMLEPNPQNIKLDGDKIRKKFQKLKKQINNLVERKDIELLKNLIKSIRNYRDAGLAQGGEFSIENIVFKALRKSGDLKRIKDTINTTYDRLVSLPEGGNVKSQDGTTPFDPYADVGKVLEATGENFLVVGFINGNLEIAADVDKIGNLKHTDVLKNHTEFKVGDEREAGIWRYKSATNVLRWYIAEPTDRQRHAVVEYLKQKVNITEPTQRLGQYGDDGYFINESFRKLVKWILTKNSKKG